MPAVTRLSLVVHLVDPWLPGGGTLGAQSVRLDPGGQVPMLNLSGDTCFLDLPAAVYTLRVASMYYFPERVAIDLAQLPPVSPVQEVILRPTPAYPFAVGTTLLRGSVRDTDGMPVPDAIVTVLGGGPQTRTTERGEFVLAWFPLTAPQVYTEIQDRTGVIQRFVKGDSGGKDIRIALTHPDVQPTQHTIAAIVEGTTVRAGILPVARHPVAAATAAARSSRVRRRTRRTRPRQS